MKADKGKMKYSSCIPVFVLLALGISPVRGAAETQDENGVKVNGFTFNIAKDRKIEKVGGIYEPEGIDKYVERRMNEVAERMQRMEAQLDETNRKLDKLSLQLAAAAPASAATADPHSK